MSYVSVSHASYLEKSVDNAVHEYLDAVNKVNGEDTGKTFKNGSMSTKYSRSQRNNENDTPSQILCVEAICDVVVEQLPDLWRLGQSYFTGQLHVAVDTEKQSHFKVRTLCLHLLLVVEKIYILFNLLFLSQDCFHYNCLLQNLVLSSMQHAMQAMKNTCSHDVEATWLLHTLRCVRQMYASLIHLDLPSEALDIFGSFILDLRYIQSCLKGIYSDWIVPCVH